MGRFGTLLAFSAAVASVALGCGLGTDNQDHGAPSVVITSPTTDTVFGSVVFSVDASDDVGVKSVRFTVDTTVLFVDFDAPYTTVWSPGRTGVGAHQLKAEAFDSAGNSSTTSKVVVVVSGPQ
jgi:Bacterial Ig domain